MSRTISRTLATLAFLAAAGMGSLVAAAPAQAATSCYASLCTGLNPATTICANDARTVSYKHIYFSGHDLGFIELRYSPGCRAAWARLTNYMNHVAFDSHAGYAIVHRNSDGKQYTCYTPVGVNKSCYTKMVGDAGTTSYALGDIDPYPTYGYGTARAKTASY
jgi:hypothetical protein